jgi:hypothetical protein
LQHTHRCAVSALAVVAAWALSACTTLTSNSDEPLYVEPSASASTARVRFVAQERGWSAYVAENPALHSCYVFEQDAWRMLPFKRTRSDEAQLGMPTVAPVAARRASYRLIAGRGITVQVALERNHASSGGAVTVVHTQTCRDNVAFVPEAGKDYEVHANWLGEDGCRVSLWGVARDAAAFSADAASAEPQGKLVPVPYVPVQLPIDAQAFKQMCTPEQRSKQARALPQQP